MFKAWPKIPRLENEIYHITEKIDGTNGCIIIADRTNEPSLPEELASYGESGVRVDVFAQSRTRLITPENDNYGFAKWVKDNADQLTEDLGVGYHYGEWWGQGIQRGYGLDHKRFSLFNPTKHSSVCYNVPMLYSLTEDQFFNTTWREQIIAEYKEFGSAAANYMHPEGFVIYAEKTKCYWKEIIDK